MASVVDTSDKFVCGVVDTADEQLITGVIDTTDNHSFAIISANLKKKVVMIPNEILMGPGTLVHEKKLRSKISCQTPLKPKLRFSSTQNFMIFTP